MTLDINAWLKENADYQSDNEIMSKAGMDHFEILLVLAYMVEYHYINPESYTEWDVSRLLEEKMFEFFSSKEEYGKKYLSDCDVKLPDGLDVNWNASADTWLTDVPHYEFENGSIAVWEDN